MAIVTCSRGTVVNCGKNVDKKLDSKSSQPGVVSTWMGDLIRIPTEGLDFYSFCFFSFFLSFFFCFHFIAKLYEYLSELLGVLSFWNSRSNSFTFKTLSRESQNDTFTSIKLYEYLSELLGVLSFWNSRSNSFTFKTAISWVPVFYNPSSSHMQSTTVYFSIPIQRLFVTIWHRLLMSCCVLQMKTAFLILHN